MYRRNRPEVTLVVLVRSMLMVFWTGCISGFGLAVAMLGFIALMTH